MLQQATPFAILLVAAAVMNSSCDIDCFPGFGGPTHTATLVVEQPFSMITLALGDSVLFQPENNLEIVNQATDDGCSDGVDYNSEPMLDRIGITDQEVASIVELTIANEEGQWTRQYYLHGNGLGRTTLNLEVKWYGEAGGPSPSYLEHESFAIDLEVVQSAPIDEL